MAVCLIVNSREAAVFQDAASHCPNRLGLEIEMAIDKLSKIQWALAWWKTVMSRLKLIAVEIHQDPLMVIGSLARPLSCGWAAEHLLVLFCSWIKPRSFLNEKHGRGRWRDEVKERRLDQGEKGENVQWNSNFLYRGFFLSLFYMMESHIVAKAIIQGEIEMRWSR